MTKANMKKQTSASKIDQDLRCLSGDVEKQTVQFVLFCHFSKLTNHFNTLQDC